MTTHQIHLPNLTLTRVGYVDVAVPPELLGLTSADVSSVPWASPIWAEGDQPRFGAAVWLADVDGHRLAFDPFYAADSVLRSDRAAELASQGAIDAILTEAGYPRETVDILALSHIEGVGMAAWRNEDGSWSRFFPNARVLVGERVLEAFLAAAPNEDDALQRDAWQALLDQNVVDTFADGEAIAAGVRAEVRDGHCPGHTVFHLGGDGASGEEASFIGHLAVSPVHLTSGECAALNVDATAAWSVLQDVARDGQTLIGPLWPAPGYGRWVDGALVSGA